MAKPATLQIKLLSTADTGFFYVTNERPSGFYLSKNNKSKLFIPLLEKENAERIKVDDVHIYEEFPGKINPYSFMNWVTTAPFCFHPFNTVGTNF